MKTLKNILAIISGFALLAFLYRLFSSRSTSQGFSFPLEQEKKELQKEITEAEQEIESLGEKVYSDEDIDVRFNKK